MSDLVDVEALFVELFLADAGITELVAEEVSTELPKDLPLPRLQLLRAPGSAFVTPETRRIERARLLCASWGATKAAAFDVAQAAVTALAGMIGAHDLGVITAIDVDSAPYWSPDPEEDLPRYLFNIAATVHP